MRTTLTIEDHLFRELKEEAQRARKPLKRVVNEAIREGLTQLKRPPSGKAYRSKTFSLGYPPQINLDKALGLSAALEEEEIARKFRLRK
jgi:hypothetical protein